MATPRTRRRKGHPVPELIVACVGLLIVCAFADYFLVPFEYNVLAQYVEKLFSYLSAG